MSLKPTCKEVHQLTSESMDRELTLVERTRVRMHLLVCNACRNFTEQMDLLRKAMRRMVPDKENGDDSL
ncbi:zf-HC2 domain-containing protein [Noviherbaspirillum sp. ST9]|uniref:zf-HC2 domain-containing protein n=1 Tax=Noviherbaspirillum sp. ST9 TaxID=3401606 RepID=UPI003B589872